MIRVIKAPQNEMLPVNMFLAGTIDMGNSEDWQSSLIKSIEFMNKQEHFNNIATPDIYIFNPRRDDWDSSWEQSIDNDEFNEQVTWELDHIEEADLVVINFEPDSKSPITLLELGLVAGADPQRMIVRCPKEFYRRGNVEIVCERYGIPMFDEIDDFVSAICERLDLLMNVRRDISHTQLTHKRKDSDELR